MNSHDVTEIIVAVAYGIVMIITALKSQAAQSHADATADHVDSAEGRIANQVLDLHGRIDQVSDAVSGNLNTAIQQLGQSVPATVQPPVVYSASQSVLPFSSSINTALGTNATAPGPYIPGGNDATH